MRIRVPSRAVPLLVASFGLLIAAAPARAADEVEATVPFAFTAGWTRLPAGRYAMTVDWRAHVVFVENLKSGREIAAPFLTTLSPYPAEAASRARVVFANHARRRHVLSEVWLPGLDGVVLVPERGPGLVAVSSSTRMPG